MAPRASPALLFLALGAVTSLAQEAEEEPASAEEGPRYYVFEEEVDLADLMAFWTERLSINLQYDPSKLKGPVTLRTTAGVTEETLWAVTNRTLALHGLACVQAAGEGNLSVVSLEEAPRIARIEEDPERARAGFIKARQALRYAEATAARDAVKGVLTSPGAAVTELPGTKELLLVGLKPQVLEAREVVRALDRPGAPPLVHEFPLEEADPVSVVALVERVAAAHKKVAPEGLRGTAVALPERGALLVISPEEEFPLWMDLVGSFDRAEPVTTRSYVPRRFGLAETRRLVEEVVGASAKARQGATWRVVSDELTGTLLVTAGASDHAEVEALLERLEAAPAAERFGMRAIPVRHRKVEDLLALLERLLEEGALPGIEESSAAAPSPSKSQEAPPPETAAPKGATGGKVIRPDAGILERITLTADPGANRILAVGEGRLLDQVASLVSELDVPGPQVLVEVLVLSLTESESRDLGVELQKIIADGEFRYELASLFGLGLPDPLTGSVPAATGAGLSGIFLDPGDFSMLVRALEVVNRGRSLTMPSMLVNNNEEALLQSVVQRPFTSVNASDTVATTSFGGTLDAGTTVRVQPQIADGDRLVLTYSVAISSFVGEAPDPTVPPPRQENSLASVVTIPDGHTVVLGGLAIEAEADAVSRIPGLGKVPILGKLFQSSSRSADETRFYAFIRADVLRSGGFEDLKYLSGRGLAEAGIGDGYPVLEPRLIQ